MPEITAEERERKLKGWNKAVKYALHWAKDEVWGNELYKCFNTGKMTLLFGEKLNKQSLVQLPYDMERLLSKKGGNHFIMSYRGELHHLIMPCGELRKETVKTDDDSIFEDG